MLSNTPFVDTLSMRAVVAEYRTTRVEPSVSKVRWTCGESSSSTESDSERIVASRGDGRGMLTVLSAC